MSRIGIKEAVMQEKADDILRQNEEIANLMQAVIAAVDEATANWDGKSQCSYIEKFESIKPIITNQLYDCLMGLGNELKAVSNSFVSADQAMSSKIKL